MKPDNHNEIIFSDPKDVTRMQRLKSAYLQSFPERSSFSEIPDLLNIEEKIEGYLLFSSRKVVFIKQALEAEKIQMDHFKKSSANLNRSPIRDYSLAVISTGINYIKEREEDRIRRLNGLIPFSEPYDNIQDPRYYIIQIISERLKTLCDWRISEELANEYGYLSEFISKVLKISSELFKTSSTTGFHYFLYEAQEKVNIMKKMVLIYHEKSSIPSQLSELIRLLDSYKSELTGLMVHILSYAPHNGTFHAHHLKDENDPRINSDFLKTDSYQSIRAAYLNQKLDFITINSRGIKNFSGKFSKDSLEKAIKHYNNLLYLLFNASQLTKNIELLIKSSNLEGDWETARDEALNSVLDANLAIASEFIKEIDKSAVTIYQIGRKINKKSKCIAGFPMNLQYSANILSEMQKIQEDIEKNRTQIKKRIEKINMLEPNTKKNIKDEVIIKTHYLMEKLKGKLKGIPTSIIRNMKNLINKNKEIKQLELKNIIKSDQKNPYNITRLINNDKARQEVFDNIIAQINQEIDVNMTAFIDKFEIIKQLAVALNEILDYGDDFDSRAEYLFYGLKKYSKELTYQSWQFALSPLNEISLDGLFQTWMEDQLLKISQLLTPLNSQSNEEVEIILNEIKNDINHKINKLNYRFISIKSFFPGVMTNAQTGLAHYESHIAKTEGFQSINRQQQKVISSLFIIAIELKHSKSAEELKQKLNQFYQGILSINYILHYYGGEKLESRPASKKFPRHIKQILDFYNNHIQVSHSLQHYQWMLNETGKIAKNAIHNKGISVRFFRARELVTEHVYHAITTAAEKALSPDFSSDGQVPNAATSP